MDFSELLEVVWEQPLEKTLAAQLTIPAGLGATELEVNGREREVSIPISTCLYRVTQEALANVFKHAQASRVDVTLGYGTVDVGLEIRDDGLGFDTSTKATGLGLDFFFGGGGGQNFEWICFKHSKLPKNLKTNLLETYFVKAKEIFL